MKKTTKTTKKIVPVYTVDITKAETVEDIVLAIAAAKIEANIPLSPLEHNAIIANAIKKYITTVLDVVTADNHGVMITPERGFYSICLASDAELDAMATTVYKKNHPNIFKRFWNWITRKK